MHDHYLQVLYQKTVNTKEEKDNLQYFDNKVYVAKGNRIELHYTKHNLEALENASEKLIVHKLFRMP